LLPALLTTALVAVPGMLNASQAKPCQSGFFLSAGVGMVNHGLKLTKSADQVKANAQAAFDGLVNDLVTKIVDKNNTGTAGTAAPAAVVQADAAANFVILETQVLGVSAIFITGRTLYIAASSGVPGATPDVIRGVIKDRVAGRYAIDSVVFTVDNATTLQAIKVDFADADKPKFEDAKLGDLSFRVANKDIALYQEFNGKEVSTYTSPKGVAFQLMGGYRHTLGNNMAAALAAYFGFGLGNGRNSKAGDVEELKTKERFHYGLELHLGAYVTPTTFLFAKGVIESTSFKFANYNKVGTKTEATTKDGHAHTTHFRPGMGVGMTTNIQKNLGVGIDYTYLFNSGGKDLKVGGSDAAGKEMKVGRIKGDTHRVMLRLIWTI